MAADIAGHWQYALILAIYVKKIVSLFYVCYFQMSVIFLVIISTIVIF